MSTMSLGNTTKRAAFWQSPTVRRAAIDFSAITVLLLTGVIAFGPVFGGVTGYAAAGGGMLAGSAIALIGTWRKWTKLGIALAVMLTYLLLGGPLALPNTTIAGVIPTLETLQRLILLSWQSWRDLLTVSLPASEFEGPAVMPFLAGLIASVVAVSLALHRQRAPWALLPALAFLTLGILWGSHEAPLAGLQGVVFTGVSLGWLAWRSQIGDPHQQAIFASPVKVRAPRLRLAGFGLGAVVLVSLLGLGLLQVLDHDDRYVLRDDITPPLDLREYASPLTLFRDLESTKEKIPLFTVDGLPAGTRIRLATMDQYDGRVYNVTESSALFGQAGSKILPGRFSSTDRETARASIAITGYSGVWLPGGGDLRGVEFSGSTGEVEAAGLYYNPATGTALTTAGIANGTVYDVSLVPPPTYDAEAVAALPDADLGDIELPQSTAQLEAVSEAALKMIGDASTPLDQLRAVANEFATTGFYANGTKDESLAGHTSARIQLLLSNPTGQMVGDDEQYAVAMALVARQLGMPARVVMGFYPDPAAPSTSGPVTITGDDAHVWVEVLFDGHGWVPFDPTPDEDQRPNEQQPEPEERNDPQVLPPPEVPVEQDQLPPAKAESDQKDRDPDKAWPWFVKFLAIGVAGVALSLLPLFGITALKSRRRRTRRSADLTADRISGGWAELSDVSADLGTAIPRNATRTESAVLIGATFGVPAATRVAAGVDAYVFGPHPPTDAEVDLVWSQVDQTREGLLNSVNLRRRLQSRFSIRSLLRPSDRPTAATPGRRGRPRSKK